MAADAFMICLFSYFLYVFVGRVIEGSYTTIVFAVEQAVLVGIYLVRRKPMKANTRWDDWTVATLGGWLSLAYGFLEPGDVARPLQIFGVSVQVFGGVLVILGFLTLGRSFGIVAANRGLKVTGIYSFVRHPIYLAHAITALGLVIAAFTPAILALWCIIIFFQVLRIRAEERVLTESGEYAAYKARVRWRLIPGVY